MTTPTPDSPRNDPAMAAIIAQAEARAAADMAGAIRSDELPSHDARLPYVGPTLVAEPEASVDPSVVANAMQASDRMRERATERRGGVPVTGEDLKFVGRVAATAFLLHQNRV